MYLDHILFQIRIYKRLINKIYILSKFIFKIRTLKKNRLENSNMIFLNLQIFIKIIKNFK